MRPALGEAAQLANPVWDRERWSVLSLDSIMFFGNLFIAAFPQWSPIAQGPQTPTGALILAAGQEDATHCRPLSACRRGVFGMLAGGDVAKGAK